MLAGLVVTVYVAEYLDKMISICGVLIGMSNVLFIPALCHYELMAETKIAKAGDIAIMCFAVFMLFFGPFTIIRQW